MVEVLRKGDRPEDRVYTGTCIQCRSLLRFKRSEARFVSDQRDGDAVVVECPVCKKDLWVSADRYEKSLTNTDVERQL